MESHYQHEPALLGYESAEAQRRRRRWIIIGSIVALVLIAGVIFAMRAKNADKAADGGKQVSTVTVIVPGRTTIDGVVNATGSLAARREMPVGVAGEGGMIAQVLVEPGQWVGAGQVLATIDRRVQVQQANALGAQIGVAEADARLAQEELDRALALVGRGFISKADVQRKTSARDAARARVNVARAQLSQSQASNSRLDIRAPAAGLVLTRSVEPGQVVSPGSGVLFRLAKGGEMELRAQVPEADLAHMSVGLGAQVTPVGTAQAFTGQIWQLSPVIDPQTRQGIARIALAYNTALRPGGFASAQVRSGTVFAPLLPESAVQHDPKGAYVLIVNDTGKVERRDVKVGDVNDQGLPIISGLAGAEKIVLNAGAFLNPGETVKIVLAHTSGGQ